MAGKNLCSGCNLVFGSLGAFDMHRIGSYREPIYEKSSTGKSQKVVDHTKPTRRCMTLDEIKAAGMVQNEKGWWLAGGFSGFGTEEEIAS